MNMWISISYMTSEAFYDPISTQELNLHYVCHNRVANAEPFATTVTIPIYIKNDPPHKLTEPPALEQKSNPIQHHRQGSVGSSCQKGLLHSDKAIQNEKLDILVTPLDDLVLEGGRGALRISIPHEELKCHPQDVKMDMDEATGRIVIWGWNGDPYETKILVGDLV